MPTPADRPLRKCTLNLYEEDCAILEKCVGQGWTTIVREWIHEATFRNKATLGADKSKRTLGDLDAKG